MSRGGSFIGDVFLLSLSTLGMLWGVCLLQTCWMFMGMGMGMGIWVDRGRDGMGCAVLLYFFFSPLLAGVKYWATAERYPACGPSLKYTKGV